MSDTLFGISYPRILNFIIALCNAAVGMLCVMMGLEGILSYSEYPALSYSVLGFGFVFLLAAFYNVRDCFREGSLESDEKWSEKAPIPVLLVLLWIFILSLEMRFF